MFKRKRWSPVAVTLVALCFVFISGIASAWEFTMEGSLSWELEAIGQQGQNGFFGRYDVDAGSGIAGAPAGTFGLNGVRGPRGSGDLPRSGKADHLAAGR